MLIPGTFVRVKGKGRNQGGDVVPPARRGADEPFFVGSATCDVVKATKNGSRDVSTARVVLGASLPLPST